MLGDDKPISFLGGSFLKNQTMKNRNGSHPSLVTSRHSAIPQPPQREVVQVPGPSADKNRVNDEEAAEALRLLRLAGQGDSLAFNELVIRHHALAVRYARTVLRTHEDAEDAAQDAWIALWRRCPELMKEDRPDACAIGLIASFARLSARDIVGRRNRLKRGHGMNPEHRDSEVRRELHNLHQYRRHGVNFEMVERTPEADPMAKMGMVHRLMFHVPPAALSALDAYFFKGKGLGAVAQDCRTSIEGVKRAMHDGIEVIRHLAAKEPEMQEAL